MASNALFIIPDLFFCIFQTNLAMATLGLNEMGKFLWEGGEKVLPSWLSQFSFAKLRSQYLTLFFGNLIVTKILSTSNPFLILIEWSGRGHHHPRLLNWAQNAFLIISTFKCP